MVCASLTVVAAKPVVSNLSLWNLEAQGDVGVSWSQDKAGMIQITADGAVIVNQNFQAGNNSTTLSGLSVGTHNICVTAP